LFKRSKSWKKTEIQAEYEVDLRSQPKRRFCYSSTRPVYVRLPNMLKAGNLCCCDDCLKYPIFTSLQTPKSTNNLLSCGYQNAGNTEKSTDIHITKIEVTQNPHSILPLPLRYRCKSPDWPLTVVQLHTWRYITCGIPCMDEREIGS